MASIGSSLVVAARLYRTRTAELLNHVGLFPGQEQLLLALSQNGAMSIGDLATHLSVRPATISKMVTRLSSQGFLERLGTDGDARRVMVQLSHQGHEVSKQIDGIGNQIDEEMLAAFDGKDRKRLRKLLRRAIATLSANGDSEVALADQQDSDD
jgi:MarR family transcriptional regulator, transcriptional regulator for hemolysin